MERFAMMNRMKGNRNEYTAATTEPRLLQGVLVDLERHIALRDAFRKLMEAKR